MPQSVITMSQIHCTKYLCGPRNTQSNYLR